MFKLIISNLRERRKPMILHVFAGMNWSRQTESTAKVKPFIFNDTNYFEYKCFNYLKQAINKLNSKYQAPL